jgi:hypothetical protein
MFNVGDFVRYESSIATQEMYGIVVGFTHNDYYYVDWFKGGCDWTLPFHVSSLMPVNPSEST